jgi:hypothetical protein
MLTASQLLDLWEACAALPPAQRALALAMAAAPDAGAPDAAAPDTAAERLASLPVGQRDRRVLALREAVFGPRIEALARCPACGEPVEVSFAASDAAGQSDDAPPARLTATADGCTAMFRPVTSLDLLDLAGCADPEAARRRLLARCVTEARRDGAPVAPDDLPEPVVSAISQALAEADPAADLRVALDCPACGQTWQERFDPPAFVWREIDAWAARALSEVHVLARAYGWREADILAMSAWRRQRYLGMVA